MPLGIGIGLSAVLLASAGGMPAPAYSGEFASDTPSGFTQSRASSATFRNALNARQTSGIDGARNDHDPASYTENLIPYSNSYGSWSPQSGATFADAGSAPDGSGRMWTVTDNSTSAVQALRIVYQGNVVPNTVCTTVFKVPKGTGVFTVSPADNNLVNVDLSNGNTFVFSNPAFATAGTEDSGTYWKVWVTFNTPSNPNTHYLEIQPARTNNLNSTSTVNGLTATRGVWGVQMYTGTYVSSARYVETQAASYKSALPRGHLQERQSTNYVLNSGAPVTQDVTLPIGSFTLWVEGTGSCTAAANTAVGSGFGTATAGAGNHNTFTVTTAGTVTLTVSGTVTIFQCESYPVPSSYIPTTGATATRAADTLSAVPSAVGLSNALVGAIVAQGAAGWTSAAGAQSFFSLEADTNNRFQLRRQGGNFAYRVRANSTDIFNGVSGVAWPLNTAVKTGLSWGFGSQAISANGATLATNNVGAISGFTPTVLVIGSGVSDTSLQGSIWWIRKIDIYASQLTETQLNAATT